MRRNVVRKHRPRRSRSRPVKMRANPRRIEREEKEKGVPAGAARSAALCHHGRAVRVVRRRGAGGRRSGAVTMSPRAGRTSVIATPDKPAQSAHTRWEEQSRRRLAAGGCDCGRRRQTRVVAQTRAGSCGSDRSRSGIRTHYREIMSLVLYQLSYSTESSPVPDEPGSRNTPPEPERPAARRRTTSGGTEDGDVVQGSESPRGQEAPDAVDKCSGRAARNAASLAPAHRARLVGGSQVLQPVLSVVRPHRR